ncbi:outer membrane protein [Gymnodinialimonas sp.]
MNRILCAIALMALSSPAQAQVTGPALSDWQGVYFGGQVEFFPDSEFTDDRTPLIGGEIEGEIGGTFIGYRHQFNSFVVGGELDYVGGDVETTLTALGAGASDGSDIGLIRAGAEVGYAFGRFLPYATAGYARIVFRNTINGDNISPGSFYGLGLDYQTGEYASVGVEVNRQRFEDFSLSPDINLDATSVSVNFAIRY